MRRAMLAYSLIEEDSGIAATEFALLLPVMAVFFFGMLEASDLFTVNRRLASATNSLVDLVAKEPSITESDIDDLIVGVTRILEPSDTSTVSMKVVSVTRGPDEDDPVLVHWSRDQNGDAPYAAGSTYDHLADEDSLRQGQSLIVAEIGYHYESNLTSYVISIPFDFNHRSVRWPRKSSRVQLCATSDPATCTS